ncbi:MAG: 30S ribosomal protein S17 [Proteobacteria bacterium]|nr:30S ribosomal protein S17 [Pseudomonadota bacterium]
MDTENTVETEDERRMRRTLQGLVVSDKMNKTVVVVVTRAVKHPRYKKYVRHSKKYLAHDEAGECGEGDLVTIVETRPLSKRKRWRVRSIDRKAVG